MEGSVSTLTSPVISPVTTAHVDLLSSAVLPEVSAAAADPQGPVPAPRAPAASMVRPVVSLIIPTKNEASNIAWVLENVPDRVDEVMLVDGRSTDATVVTAQSCRPDVRVITQEGVGKGDALRTGFRAARGDIIVMIDADGSMAPSEIAHYVHFLENGYDFVKGSRFIGGGGSRDISPTRRLGNAVLVHVVNRLYDAHLTDLCYGFCAFHRRYLDYLGVSTPGFEVEAKMIVSALKSGLRIAEVPSLEMPRRFGRSNLRTFRDGARVLRTVLREHDSGISGHAIQQVRSKVHPPSLDSSAALSPAPRP
jgi:glycosyltransferase involved in cell wall biosynthesis